MDLLELLAERANETVSYAMSALDLDLRDLRLISYTTAIVFVISWLLWLPSRKESTLQRLKNWVFGTARCLPIIGPVIQREVDKVVQSVFNDPAFAPRTGEVFTTSLPHEGLGKAAVLKRVDDMQLVLGGADWEGGRVSGVVYASSKELHDTLIRVYSRFAWSNPLHPDVFPSVRKMEGEVVQMLVNLYNGSESACGCMTSGGTESILMACRTYRQLAYERGIDLPEIVAPVSVHAAFDKACEYFNMKLVHVPVDEMTRKADVPAMCRAINSSTILLVGSAPQYAHGIVDDIEAIAALGVQYSIGVHVDACLGGFLIPFLEDAGFEPLPLFDFRVMGVTSISVDTHKFGQACKGSSVIMYSSLELRHRQYYVASDWQGGIYASPAIAGSRPGGLIASCWAAMVFHGRSGYVESTRKICTVARLIKEAAEDVPGLFVLGEPKVCVVALGSNDFDIYRLGAALAKRGWNINNLQYPPSIHICCTMRHTQENVATEFIADLQQCTAEIMKTPKAKSSGTAAIYGMAQAIPDRSIVGDIARSFLDACLSTKHSLPSTDTAKTNGQSH